MATATSRSIPHSASRSWQMPHGARMRKGLAGSLRDTQTDATTRSPSRLASQIAPVSWQRLAAGFCASKHTLVSVRPDSVRIAAAPLRRTEIAQRPGGSQHRRGLDRGTRRGFGSVGAQWALGTPARDFDLRRLDANKTGSRGVGVEGFVCGPATQRLRHEPQSIRLQGRDVQEAGSRGRYLPPDGTVGSHVATDVPFTTAAATRSTRPHPRRARAPGRRPSLPPSASASSSPCP